MKAKNPILCIAVTSFCTLFTPACLLAQQQEKLPPVHYHITDLGTLGGPFSEATSVASDGLVSGTAALANGTQHAALWYKGLKLDLGTAGLNAKNSASLNSIGFTTNDFAQVVGASEVSPQEKDSENFCGYGTGLKCVPFLWQGGVMTALPLLGGKNGQAISINDRGQAVGVAEEGIADKNCVAPQTNDFEAVLWGPGQGEIQKLRPLPGDSVGIGLWVNDKGQVVGQSGSCGNTLLPPLAVGPHAVLWENGTVTDLGNLGGACITPCRSAALGPLGNTALFIGNKGQVVGTSVLAGEQTQHAFLWTRETGMKDLGTVTGDYASVALGANEKGEVVGLSIDKTGVPRAFLRRNAVMIDLNSLLQANAPIHALVAEIINSSDEIVGFGVNGSGQTHAFLATPCP
jgi:probable HAF family extracellular repeat protein